jgi:FkbM family methyltransferase
MSLPIDSAPWGAHAPRGLAGTLLRWFHRLPPRPRFWYRVIRTLRGPLKRGPVRDYDVDVLGLRLRLRTRGNFCETTMLFAPQFYDVPELQWLTDQLQDGGTFLDIGGNIGLYSLVISHRLGDRVQVHTVEPDAELSARMRFNAATNGLQPQLAATALSDFEGSATLVIDTRQRGQNNLRDDGAAGATTTRDVPVTTLVRLCEERGIDTIRAMKIDVEGHEPRILGHFFDHAPASLWPRALLIEYVHERDGLMDRLTGSLGYRLVARTPRNAMLLRSSA